MAFTQSIRVFNIPKPIVDTLTLRDTSPIQVTAPQPEPTQADAQSTSLTCSTCKDATFASVAEKRDHFRSEWHLYNLRVKRQSHPKPVSQRRFKRLNGVGDSDSDSSSSESSSSEDENRPASPSSEPEAVTIGSPIVWFTTPSAPNAQLGVYAALFSQSDNDSHSQVAALKTMQTGGKTGKKWAVFMLGGGHFAGAVVRVAPPGEDEESGNESAGKAKGKGKARSKKNPFDIEVLRHKSVHRYTTRRKQGGTQSKKDSAKGTRQSAGAMLRRYNEQALQDDVRACLSEWAEDIKSCELIFLRANPWNRRIFLDYEGCLIQKDDERLRSLPFFTRRPTQEELLRCINELVFMKVADLSTEDPPAPPSQTQSKPTTPLPSSTPTTATPRPSKPSTPVPRAPSTQSSSTPTISLANQQKYRRLLEMIRKGRVEALKTFWEKEGGTMDGVEVPSWFASEGAEGKALGRVLQVASESGQEEIVRWLLADLHADPTISVPGSNPRKTAYDLATTKEIRTIFRKCAYDFADWWDWLGMDAGGARVPSALTPEIEEGKKEKVRKWVRRKYAASGGREEFTEDGIKVFSHPEAEET